MDSSAGAGADTSAGLVSVIVASVADMTVVRDIWNLVSPNGGERKIGRD